MARSARGGRPSCSAMISRSASVTGSNRCCCVLFTRSRLERAPERPNVAFGAFNAPKAAFGALNATKATLGRSGSAAGDLVPEVLVPGTVVDLLLSLLRRRVRGLVLGQLDDVRRLARLDVPQPAHGLGLDLRRVAQLRLAALELSERLLQLSLLRLLF